MARFAACAALAAFLPLAALAQPLPRLHVLALSLRTDRPSVPVGVPFHVTVHLRVAEHPERLDQLVLPTLTNAVDLGDDRRRVAQADGTDFYTTLTVKATALGAATFSPAYLDAIDAATGKALRYSSDPVTVAVVAATPAPSPAPAPPRAEFPWFNVIWGAAVVVLVLMVIALVRPRRRGVASPAAARPRAAGGSTADDPLRDAIVMIRSRGDDESLDTLRVVLFSRAGAEPGATLSDALIALGERDPQLGRILRATERARFTSLEDRPPATRALLRLLYDYTSGVETQEG